MNDDMPKKFRILKKDSLIFIVDDDKLYHSVLISLLKKHGYTNIECYFSGEDCLEALWKHPDFIFLDYNMNGINGLETLRLIKERGSDSKVIIVSGQERVDVVLNSLKCGAYDYVIKDKNIPQSIISVLFYLNTSSPYAHINKNITPQPA